MDAVAPHARVGLVDRDDEALRFDVAASIQRITCKKEVRRVRCIWSY